MKTFPRKRLNLLTLTVLSISSGQAFSAPVLINFDDRPGLVAPIPQGRAVPPEFLVNDEYLSFGVLFNSSGGGIFLAAGSNPVSAPNVAAGTGPGPVVDYQAPVTATFSIDGIPAVVDVVRLDLTSSSSLSVFSAFDAGGRLLGSVSGGMSETLQLSFSGRIHSVVLSEGPVAFDNFVFDGLTPVPEPSTWALLCVGFGATVLLRKVCR